MRNRVWWLWLVALVDCRFGPSEEELACYQGCGRYKDSCMLQATTAQHIQICDTNSSRCSEACQ